MSIFQLIVGATILVASQAQALRLPGAPQPKIVYSNTKDHETCVDFSGRWSGECTVMEDAPSPYESRIKQLGCREIEIDGRSYFISGTETNTAAGNGVVISDHVVFNWNERSDRLLLKITTIASRGTQLDSQEQVEAAIEWQLIGNRLSTAASYTVTIFDRLRPARVINGTSQCSFESKS